jgi:flagellar biosynthesis/type III secretory pathway protein FliH
MAEMLESATTNYKILEDEHFKNINTMEEAEEQARTEAAKRTQMERKMAEMQEKMRQLESECIQSIGKAREEGKEEGMAEGKELGKEGAMDEVKTQFQMVYNSGFRHGWKSALNKTKQPKTLTFSSTPTLHSHILRRV